MFMASALTVIALWLLMNGVYYLWWIEPAALVRHRLYQGGSAVGYGLTYILSVLRLPFAFLPYATKLSLFLLFRAHYSVGRYHTLVEGLRILGDFANLFITVALMRLIGLPESLVYLTAWAEFIRLLSEKGQMMVSAGWQYVPHSSVAGWLRTHKLPLPFLRAWSARYCAYYGLDDAGRMRRVLKALYEGADEVSKPKLAYVTGFRVVDGDVGLRAGAVRDVARGEIFIHQRWLNDPWLLAGQALRRAPWMFDPRYLARPFFYRTQSNRLATLLVFYNSWLCGPYALYQIGHEVKAARYDLFYRLLRWLGFGLEAPVQADGSAQFDPLIKWLKRGLNGAAVSSHPLWTESEALSDAARRLQTGEAITPLQIALDYTFPLRYVDEVLWPQLKAAV